MTDPPSLVLHDAQVRGERVDVRCERGEIVAIARPGAARDADVSVDAGGGALLPGLHDHHVHLLATAAAFGSLDCTHPSITDAVTFAAALRTAAETGGWIRAVGYHESIAGHLDRDVLDAIAGDRPVRVQHASGGLWVLNSAAVEALGLDADGSGASPAEGVERDHSGRATGRLWRRDDLLRTHGSAQPPDLAPLGAALAAVGVTGVTDATPFDEAGSMELIARAVESGALPQRVQVMRGPGLQGAVPAELLPGPVKLLLHDHHLPPVALLCDWVRAAREHERAVAVHCVTAEALALTTAALRAVGPQAGDRVEHGAVVLPGMHEELASLGVTVVTQPGFVARRGDRYLREVEATELPHLWPCRSLTDAGVRVAGGTDSPYGPPDPWEAIAAAVTRRTLGGEVLGEAEAVPADRALALFLGRLDDPAGPPRRVEVGAPADLCLLDVPLRDALADPSSDRVAATIIAGEIALAR